MSDASRVEIVPVELRPHPDADSLSIVDVWGYTVVVRTEDWAGLTQGAYIMPDTLVPQTPQFEFLFERGKRYDVDDGGYATRNRKGGTHVRLTVTKLRGVRSYGLLVPAVGAIGDDVSEALGTLRYEPKPTIGTGGQARRAYIPPHPVAMIPVYDVNHWKKYQGVIRPGELVHISEKIHGMNGRWVCRDGEMYAGSHRRWCERDPALAWWRIVAQHPELEEFCRQYPGYTVYGEVAGVQKGFDYGCKPGEIGLYVFDILGPDGVFLDVDGMRLMCDKFDIHTVPVIAAYRPYFKDEVLELVDGLTLTRGDHIREGIVIKPMREREHPKTGRVILKLVSDAYLEAK